MQLREPLGRGHLPAQAGRSRGRAIDLLLARAASGSKRGARGDHRTLALAIEGGGQAGAVSAGMCVVLEELGLIDAVDVIYGTSAGALNGSFTASGQAAKAATNYEDATGRWFANPVRMLAGKPAVNLDHLFDEIIRKRKPYNLPSLANGPRFFAVATDIATGEPVALGRFHDFDEMLLAVRTSCSIPYLTGPPVRYRGIPMTDGCLSDSMAYRTALAGGATDVIVLRSRAAVRLKGPYSPKVIAWLRQRASPRIAELVQARPAQYNADARELLGLTEGRGSVMQVAPPLNSIRVGQAERSIAKIRAGFAAGAWAMTHALGVAPVSVLWEPRAYVSVDVDARFGLYDA